MDRIWRLPMMEAKVGIYHACVHWHSSRLQFMTGVAAECKPRKTKDRLKGSSWWDRTLYLIFDRRGIRSVSARRRVRGSSSMPPAPFPRAVWLWWERRARSQSFREDQESVPLDLPRPRLPKCHAFLFFAFPSTSTKIEKIK